MAVPTISAVNPASGHSGGRTLVEVLGTGFALPPAPPARGPAPLPPPSVVVTFGGAPALVQVVSGELLYVLTPEGDPDGGAVAVLVQNCDASGDPILGEVAVAATAFTFLRPDLSEESELARLVRALLQSLKRQVLKNTVFTTHTDYDDATGDQLNFTAVESLPAVILANLDVPEDRHYAANEEVEVDVGGGRFIKRRPPLVVDVNLTVVGVSNDPVEILGLMQAVRLYFKKNPRLTYARNAADPSRGTVSYDMGFAIVGGVGVQHAGDNANVESFAGQVTVFGVLLEDIPGLPHAKPAGIPVGLPHEATTGFGWQAGDDPARTAAQAKP